MSLVSVYPRIDEIKQGHNVALAEVMDLIRSNRWEDQINHVREAVELNLDKSEISKRKAKLPYFTGSGCFSVRKDAGLINHSGRLVIDFDHDEVDRFGGVDILRTALIADKYSEYIFKSCTGTGLAVIVKIKPDEHKQIFNFLEKYYASTYICPDGEGIKLDTSCKDVSRPRYISYDPDLFHNANAELAELPTSELDGDESKYEWTLKVHNKRETFTEGNRHHYMVLLGFFLNKCGVSEDYALNRYLTDFLVPGKEEKEIREIIKYCYKNTIDHGTFTINKQSKDLPQETQDNIKEVYKRAHSQNHAGRKYDNDDIDGCCKEFLLSKDLVRNIYKNVFEKNTDEFGLDKKPDIYAVEVFIRKRWDIRRNVITSRNEFRPQGSAAQFFEQVNNDEISRELQHARFKFTLDKVKSLLKSNFVPSYDPFRSYFESLPEWDGEDHLGKLAGYITMDTQENQKFWVEQFKKAMIRTITCALDHIVNRIIMNLVGKNQETGKSSFIKFLCPPELSAYYTETSPDNSKDSDIQLSENIIWNFDELASLSSIGINKFKTFISKSTVKQRGAYKEFTESNPRRCTFWASTNKTEFLTDDQNTRWLCFNVESINHNYSNYITGKKEVDINQVWAQAWHLYKSGENGMLTQEENKIRDINNKEYEAESSERDLILMYFRSVTPFDEGCEFMTATEIMIELVTKTDNKIKINSTQLGRTLKQLEFLKDKKKVDGAVVKGYYVARIGSSLGQATIKYDKDPHQIKPL
jgi:hypothetical protein